MTVQLAAEADVAIERLDKPLSEGDLAALAALLVEAVGSGAAVSFIAPLELPVAAAWWRQTIEAATPRFILLVARAGGTIVGTVQLQPAWAPNQTHRGEVVKLLVSGACQRRGLGTRLMHAIEAAARAGGFRLLTLDARAGGAAERLYRGVGWTALGVVPRYAVDTDGVTLHDAVFFYKELA